MRRTYFRISAVVVLVAGLAGAAVAQDEKPKPVRFSAFATNLGAGPNAGVVDIVLERLSSDEERAGLIAAFVEGGQDALLKALQKVKPRVGFIRTPNSLGYDLQYAYRFVNADGSSRVVIATDRRIGFLEARNQPRTIDYPFTLIEMRLDAKGEGEGKIAVATKITKSKDGKTVELENYGIAPVVLNNLKIRN